jgi:hypothetical protein
MREVFKLAPAADPGQMFYTITVEDVGKSLIETTEGVIRLPEVIGRVMSWDVGKRLYRVPADDGSSWVWQAENGRQRDARLAQERSGEAR